MIWLVLEKRQQFSFTEFALWLSTRGTLALHWWCKTASCQPRRKAVLKTRAIQTLRDCRTPSNCAKRLDCGAFTAAFSGSGWSDLYVLPWLGANNVAFDDSNGREFYHLRAYRPLMP
jgi:hypothetical protein